MNTSILLILLVLLSGCGKQQQIPEVVDIYGRTMGTTYSVKLVKSGARKTLPEEDVKQISTGIEQVLKKVNRQMSTYIKDSEISRFNRYNETGWFDVSSDTIMVLAESMKLSEKSAGAFDITMGPLINLWGFGPAGKDNVIPDPEEIETVMKRIGYTQLEVRQSPPAIRKHNTELYCSLAGIAKGFGVDKVADYLDSRGFEDYLVEIGGEVRVKGVKPGNHLWRVGIATPGSGNSFQKIILLKNESMATSGDYHNYFEKNGQRYSHTISPNTGQPITHKLASVTVIHNSCMTADGIATAIDVMGPEKGYQLALREKLAVFMIIRGEKGFIEKMTPEFKRKLNVKK